MSSDTPFRLRPITDEDTAPVRHLWSRRFGGAPDTQKKWMEAVLTPNHSATGFVAEPAPATEVVGFSLLDIAGRDYTRRYLGLETLDLAPPLTDRNGIFHLSCVRADWEGRGIGTAFYERRLGVLAKQDVPRAFGIAWHRPHTVDSRVLFEKHNFSCLATVERYYSRTGARPHCPACANTCVCTASLYGRAWHQRE